MKQSNLMKTSNVESLASNQKIFRELLHVWRAQSPADRQLLTKICQQNIAKFEYSVELQLALARVLLETAFENLERDVACVTDSLEEAYSTLRILKERKKLTGWKRSEEFDLLLSVLKILSTRLRNIGDVRYSLCKQTFRQIESLLSGEQLYGYLSGKRHRDLLETFFSELLGSFAVHNYVSDHPTFTTLFPESNSPYRRWNYREGAPHFCDASITRYIETGRECGWRQSVVGCVDYVEDTSGIFEFPNHGLELAGYSTEYSECYVFERTESGKSKQLVSYNIESEECKTYPVIISDGRDIDACDVNREYQLAVVSWSCEGGMLKIYGTDFYDLLSGKLLFSLDDNFRAYLRFTRTELGVVTIPGQTLERIPLEDLVDLMARLGMLKLDRKMAPSVEPESSIMHYQKTRFWNEGGTVRTLYQKLLERKGAISKEYLTYSFTEILLILQDILRVAIEELPCSELLADASADTETQELLSRSCTTALRAITEVWLGYLHDLMVLKNFELSRVNTYLAQELRADLVGRAATPEVGTQIEILIRSIESAQLLPLFKYLGILKEMLEQLRALVPEIELGSPDPFHELPQWKRKAVVKRVLRHFSKAGSFDKLALFTKRVLQSDEHFKQGRPVISEQDREAFLDQMEAVGFLTKAQRRAVSVGL